MHNIITCLLFLFVISIISRFYPKVKYWRNRKQKIMIYILITMTMRSTMIPPTMMTDLNCISRNKIRGAFCPPPKEAGTTMCGRGAPHRLCVNHLRNGERYAVFRWLTICFAIGKGDSLYGTNTLRKSSDKRAYMQLEIKRARLFGFRGEMQSFFDRILRDDRTYRNQTECCSVRCVFLSRRFLLFILYISICILDYRL